MNARRFQEEFERQNEQLEAAMKALAEMGEVQLALPEELLRSIDEACVVYAPQNANVYPGVRA